MPALTSAMAHALIFILSRTLERNARSPVLRLIGDAEKYMWCFLEQLDICCPLLEYEHWELLERFITQTAFAGGCLRFRTPRYGSIAIVIRLWDACFETLDDVTLTPLQIVYFKKCSDSMLELKRSMKGRDAGKETM